MHKDSQPTFREACPADARWVCEILNQSILNDVARFEVEPWSLDQAAAWLADREPMHRVVVSELGGRVAGFASLGPYNTKCGYRATVELSVYVDQGFRGQGLGKAMCKQLIDQAGVAGVHLVVSRIAGEMTASLRLHESLGFDRVGVLKQAGFKFGRWIDVVFMQLLVGQEAPKA